MPVEDIYTKLLFPSIADYVVIGVYLIIMFLLAYRVRNRHIGQNPVYKYYVWGLFAKVAGAIAMGLVYTLYYDGGDTTGYYVSSETVVNLFFRHPIAFFRIMLGEMSVELFSYFTPQTGYPMYWGSITSFPVVRFTAPFTILGLGNYFTATILFAWFFYGGTWKLYLLATKMYPAYYKSFAAGILFFPSVLFWASGISKDAITLAGIGWFVYSMYHLFVEPRQVVKNILLLVFAGYLLFSVKAYVVVALVPGVFIWLAWNYLKRIENPLLRFISAPAAIALFLGLGLLLLQLFQPFLGEYGSLDGIIRKAIITYQDHTRAVEYGQNFYSLGTFDGTRWNFFSKAPAAIMAGLFRPYLWDARTVLMLVAGIENTILLGIFLVVLWRTGPIKTIKIIFDEPLVLFSLTFAIVFAFAVGISTANFGALVRLKTPLIPFLAVGLFALFNRAMEFKKLKENPESKVLLVNPKGI